MKCNFSREPRQDYVRWAQLAGRLTNKHITSTCLQRRFEFTSRKIRFRRLENEDARVKTSFVWWRHRPAAKSVRFLPHQSVHLRCRKVLEHGEWFYIKLQTHLLTLRERRPLLFAISDKYSGRLLNFLCSFLSTLVLIQEWRVACHKFF